MSKQTSYADAYTKNFSGQHLMQPGDVVESYISEESSAEIPFGVAVAEGTDPTTQCLLPSSENDNILGIVIHAHSYAKPDQLGDDGIKPGQWVLVLRRGKCVVQCDSGCTAFDRLWVRAVADPGERLGAPEDADDSTDTVDCTGQGQWRTTAVADALATLEVNFTAEA